MMLKDLIVDHMSRIAAEQRLSLAPLTDDLVLLDSGLDSLGFAILAARLEDELGVDPFGAGEGINVPVTLRDFVQTYEDAQR